MVLTEKEINRLKNTYNILGINTNILTNEIVNIIINSNEIALTKIIEDDVINFLDNLKTKKERMTFKIILNFVLSLEKENYILKI